AAGVADACGQGSLGLARAGGRSRRSALPPSRDPEQHGHHGHHHRTRAPARGLLPLHRARDRGPGLSLAAVALAAAPRVAVDLDVVQGLERGDALLEAAAVIDVLAVAEQRAVGLGAAGLAPTLQIDLALDEAVGLAIDLA